jgi:uncharacterized OsmC-like protein
MSPDNVVSTSSVATPCVHEIAGAGVEGDINGEHVIVGSQSLFENNDNKKYRHQEQQQQQLKFDKKLLLNTIKKRGEGKMIAPIGINSFLVGAIVLGDKIRLGVNVMMQRLQKLGVKETVMLTGDSFDSAKVIAKQAAVTNFEFNLLPEEKVFLGGNGNRLGPMAYCITGIASCFIATFVTIAASKGIRLPKLNVNTECVINFAKTFDVADEQITEGINFQIEAESDNTSKQQLQELVTMAEQRCPAIYSMTHEVKVNAIIK